MAMLALPVAGFIAFAVYTAYMGDKGAMLAVGLIAWFGAIYWLLKDLRW